jgi:integrase
MVRRSNKEGSITERPSGRFQAQISIDYQRFCKTFDTRAEATRWLRGFLTQIDLGLSSSGAKMKLNDYFNEWLEWKRQEVKEKTWQQYSSLISRYILPSLGEKKLMELRPLEIQQLYSSLRNDGISPRKIQLTHSILHGALERALQLGLLHRNPAAVVTRPKVPTKEMQILSLDQAQKFLQVASEHRLYALFRLALLGGLRLGELLGLQWKDVDWASSELHVNRQSQRKTGGGIELSRPKTQRSVRKIQVGNATLKALMQHYTDQQRHFGTDPGWDHHIFVSLEGKPLRASGVQKAFKKLLDQSELPKIRFHDLRHTAASLLLGKGLPVLEVSRRLGHSRASTTLDTYAHLVPGMKSDAVDQLDEALDSITALLPRSPKSEIKAPEFHHDKLDNKPDFPSKSV